MISHINNLNLKRVTFKLKKGCLSQQLSSFISNSYKWHLYLKWYLHV